MVMHSYLERVGAVSAWLDAREVLLVEHTSGSGLGQKGSSNVVGVDPLWAQTLERLHAWWNHPSHEVLIQTDCRVAAPIVVVTGFVASTLEGTPTTLKRS